METSNMHCVKNNSHMYPIRDIQTLEAWNIDNLFSHLYVKNNINSWKNWLLIPMGENNENGFQMI